MKSGFGVGPKPEQSHGSDKGVRAKDAAIQISQAGPAFRDRKCCGFKFVQPWSHLVRAEHYRDLRVSAFEEWGRVVA